jgi:hypothetical protein
MARYYNILGVLFMMEFYFHSKTQHTTLKYNQQLSRHVRTIHRSVIGQLVHQNSTSAYSPPLTCHLPAPTIDCLHNSHDPQETLSTGLSLLLSPKISPLHELRRSTDDSPYLTLGLNISRLHCWVRNNAVPLHYITMLHQWIVVWPRR